jgi:hypothetical protein
MAIIAGFNTGVSPQAPNVPPANALKLGATTQITTGAASATVALPVDANGVPYKVLLVTTVVTAAWFNFNDGTGAAVAAAANTYVLSPNAPLLVMVPPGATSASAIQDTAAGHVTFVGIA